MPESRRSHREWEQRLASSARPVFLLDEKRRLRAFNTGCEQLTGVAADEVLGKVCPYATAADAVPGDLVASILAPPPQWDGVESTVVDVLVPRPDAPPLPRSIQFFHLSDEAGRPNGWLGLFGPASGSSSDSHEPPPAPDHAASALHAELASVRLRLRERFGSQSIVAKGPAMQRVVEQLALASQHVALSVLFVGETGTGKEHLARVAHFGGCASSRWFVPLDCAHLEPDEQRRIVVRLLDQHRRRESRGGAAATDQAGTVFFSQVERLPRDVQELLAREFAAEASRRPTLRLFAGSEKPVAALLTEQDLRPEFLAVMGTLTIELPALRDRPDELPVLAQHFVEEQNRRGDKQLAGVDDAVWPLFRTYEWPGNLDELASVIAEGHRHATSKWLTVADLPFRFQAALRTEREVPPVPPQPIPLDSLLAGLETRLIRLALTRRKNNLSQAAEDLGINRPRLYRRMEQLGIEIAE